MALVVAFNALAASAFDKLAPEAIASINSDLFILILSNKRLLNKIDKTEEVNFYTYFRRKESKETICLQRCIYDSLYYQNKVI
jgi:hypothetical protein